jgi:hypothetical protein
MAGVQLYILLFLTILHRNFNFHFLFLYSESYFKEWEDNNNNKVVWKESKFFNTVLEEISYIKLLL